MRATTRQRTIRITFRIAAKLRSKSVELYMILRILRPVGIKGIVRNVLFRGNTALSEPKNVGRALLPVLFCRERSTSVRIHSLALRATIRKKFAPRANFLRS